MIGSRRAFLGTFACIALVVASMDVHASTASCASSLRTELQLSAQIPSLTEDRRFSAEGEGEICYQLKGGKAHLVAASIPRLLFTAEEPLGPFDILTVHVDAMPGTQPAVDWKRFPVVELSGLDLRVRAYTEEASKVFSTDEPLIDIVLPDLTLSTEAVTVDGENGQGFVDAKRLEVQLVGAITLPEAEYASSVQWLAGREALLTLVARIENPYQKRD